MKKEKILYLECYSGISGDMTVGALLDLGGDKEGLLKVLNSLNIDGYHLHFGRKEKCGIDAVSYTHLDVYKRQLFPSPHEAIFCLKQRKSWG